MFTMLRYLRSGDLRAGCSGLCDAGMLAADGRCKTLDASADGYVRAENCIVLALVVAGSMGLDGAHGLFKSSAVNQVLCACLRANPVSSRVSVSLWMSWGFLPSFW